MNIKNILTGIPLRLRAWIDGVAIQALVFFHFAITSLAVIGVFSIVRSIFEKQYAANPSHKVADAAKYFEWLRPYFFPDHKYTIYAYVVTSALFGLLALAVFLVQARVVSEERINRRMFPWIYLLDLVVVALITTSLNSALTTSLSSALTTSPSNALMFCLLWLAVVVAPFFPPRVFGWLAVPCRWLAVPCRWLVVACRWLAVPCRWLVVGCRWLAKINLSKTLVAVFAIEFLVILFPFLTGKAIFYNEYFDIPSETLISTTAQDKPKLVDNLNYINTNKLWGNHLRYDPRINPGEDPPCLAGARIDLPKTDDLQSFVEQNKDRYYFRYPSGELCFIGPMLYEDTRTLRDIFPSQQAQIDKVFYESYEMFDRWDRDGFTYGQQVFVFNNLTEIIQTIHGLEAIFHHHFQFLNPIKELAEGRPTSKIVAAYGNNFMALKSLMQWPSGVTYTLFLTVIFSTYIIYFALVLAITNYIFHDIRYAAIVFLSSLGLIKALGYITIFTGLGYSPIRHFLDIFVVLALFQYLAGKRKLWLAGAIGLALLSVFMDRLFGSFMFIALIMLQAIRLMLGHAHSKRDEVVALMISVPAFIAIFVLSGKVVAENPYADGFLDGVWGFPVSNGQVGLFLMSILFAYLFLAYLMSRQFNQRHYLSLFLVLYAQLFLLYWLVFPNYGHMYAVLPIFIFAGVSLLRFGVAPLIPQRVERPVVAGMLVVAVFVSLWGSNNFIETRKSIEGVEKSHRIYNWNFSNMKIRSTMNPEVFADSSSLIQKYAPPGKGIYIVSQYDTVLTWLADRYSMMPLFDLGSFLNSPTAEHKAIDRLAADKPEILFVDTCIKCNPEILRPGRTLPRLHPAFADRIKEKIDRLHHLRDVFKAIENDYELVERGMLIAVYRRKGA